MRLVGPSVPIRGDPTTTSSLSPLPPHATTDYRASYVWAAATLSGGKVPIFAALRPLIVQTAQATIEKPKVARIVPANNDCDDAKIAWHIFTCAFDV